VSDRRLEFQFVGQFVAYAQRRERPDDQKAALRAVEMVNADMLEFHPLRQVYDVVRERYAKGDELIDPTDMPGDTEVWVEVIDNMMGVLDVLDYAKRIREHWQQRTQVSVLRSSLEVSERALLDQNVTLAQRAAQRVAERMMSMYADVYTGQQAATAADVVEEELAAIDAEQETGVTVPYTELEEECGPWMPGDLIGISAYSGAGKSTFAGNLMMRLTRRGVPCIGFPTEMRGRWLARAAATEANVSQRVIEKRLWKTATWEEKDSYSYVLKQMLGRPLELVNRPNITPREIIAATRVLRRRWPGQPVVVFVDHAHRLDYEGQDANEAVGPAAKAFKNAAGEEQVIFVVLFQPRKPEGGNTYSAIAGHQIRGNSMVWNELDVHLSPFRAWVRQDDVRTTSWGTPASFLNSYNLPKMAKPDSDGAHLCDDLMLVKVDKRRIGGEGPVVALRFDKVTGHAYEPHEHNSNDRTERYVK
jgi:replicative DNA helicase